jgi:GT2 family glycosyltransferase
MSISVVMLTFNNYEKFLRSMTSMFFFITDNRVKEFIFLDNGSYQVELKNFLRQLDKQISKVRVIFSDKNLGIAKGRKVLFDSCQGDYIVSLDSDIVILNPPLFIEVLYKALDVPDMMLVGGGGGDHPFFPSLEKENIDNKKSPETTGELKIVDEVAGWFHGFKSSILTKNGGKIELDEQFSPFWAEDSDFCMQIKVNGGKCCIMGKGIVAHQWSSCDKKDTQLTLEEMWNKFQDKWYKKFGESFQFEIDDDFYEGNHPECKNTLRRAEYYLKVGMIEGHFYSKEPIRYLFKDIDFVKNRAIKFGGQEMSVSDFNTKHFTYKNIVERNFEIIGGNLQNQGKDLTIVTVLDQQRGIEILSLLSKLNRKDVVVCLTTEMREIDFMNFLERNNFNFLITKFPNFYFDIVPYIITFKEISESYCFENIFNISTERDYRSYLNTGSFDMEPGYFRKEATLKIDKYCMSFIDQYMTLNTNMMWNRDCIFYEKSSYLRKLFSSLPVMETLMRCLRIPRDYIIHISPRCSPRHSMERLIGYIKPIVLMNLKTLYTVICSINNEEDFERLSKNLKNFTGGDVVVFNKGENNRLNLQKLNCNYYYHVDKDTSDTEIMKSSISNSGGENYSNFVFFDNQFQIVENIDDFLEASKYKNSCLSLKEGKPELSLFSIVHDNKNTFIENKEDIEEYLKKVNTKASWNSKTTETDEETILEYFKMGYDDGADFPLI